MSNYEYVFATNLHEKLKGQIRGRIFVKVVSDDRLYVSIQRDVADKVFNLYINNFSDRILNGWSTDYAAYEIRQDYRKFIMKKYFY